MSPGPSQARQAASEVNSIQRNCQDNSVTPVTRKPVCLLRKKRHKYDCKSSPANTAKLTPAREVFVTVGEIRRRVMTGHPIYERAVAGRGASSAWKHAAEPERRWAGGQIGG